MSYNQLWSGLPPALQVSPFINKNTYDYELHREPAKSVNWAINSRWKVLIMHHSMKANEPTESTDRPKVLLVDDILDNRILISRILKRNGVEVECANNGKEGVMKALLGDYDLILMDIQMPVMDGFQATEELRMHGYANPIVAITAHALNEHREKSLRSGFTAHVTKPVSSQTLWAILSDLCPKIRPCP